MSPADLLESLGTIGDSPEGIEQLRQLIFQLAVSGRLLPQDPNDEPASELLKKIEKKKAELIRAKKIRNLKDQPSIVDSETPFQCPIGWIWCRFASVHLFTNGFTFKSTEYQETGIGIIRMSNLKNGMIETKDIKRVPKRYLKELSDDLQVHTGDLLIGMSGSIGEPSFNTTSEVFLLNQRVGKITPVICNEKFISFYLQTIKQRFLDIASGTGIKNLSTKQIAESYFALPPLAEQHRIVVKVDELMALLDELEQARDERDAHRVAFRDSALSALQNVEDSEAVEAAWSRIATNLADCITDPADIAPLRQTILQLAVRGRLVPNVDSSECMFGDVIDIFGGYAFKS